MAVTSYTEEFTSTVSPARLFKALVTESNVFIPKIACWRTRKPSETSRIRSNGKLKYMKHRTDVLDAENLYCKYALIGCYVDFEKVESVVYEVKFEVTPGSGCVCKMTSEYHVKVGYELKVEELKEGKLRASGLFKAV
ncbi:hypothetical protein MLD38_030518 [Melastoma candidum]|uniref:Uncharacterized protein n=1 Tax=Melastoma candidum TaxID=119954 RepID=A0ACB9MLE8_9MYRT|nr:hypothetical protein MLD38_030518 [Melastoma candidum]